MKVYNQTFTGRFAGCGRFHNTLHGALAKIKGIHLVPNPGQAEIVLISAVNHRPGAVKRWRDQGKIIVHRLDGLYHREGRRDLEAPALSINRMAHLTVYQSKYNKQTMMGSGYSDGLVIYNGVDLSAIRKIRGMPRDKVFSIITAARSAAGFKRNHLINRLADIPGIRVYFAGRNFKHGKRVIYLGDLDFPRLVMMLKSAHLFFHPAVNDSCPNSVLEAMACGIPVLHSGTGGTAEIVGSCGYRMSKSIQADIRYIQNHPIPQTKIDRWMAKFDINRVAARYVEAFKIARSRR